jgi:hypothetical protein
MIPHLDRCVKSSCRDSDKGLNIFMLSFQQYLNEEVKKAEIEGLRKEALMFSKNIRRIKNGHDLFVVAQAYAKWLHMIQVRTFSQLLGVDDAWKDKPKQESYASSQLRTKMWDLVMADRIFTPRIWSNHKLDDPTKAPLTGEDHVVYRYNDASKGMWDEYYSMFDRERTKIYTKFGKLVRDAFNALDEWLAEQPDTMLSHHHTETFKHDGVVVMFVASDTQHSDANTRKEQKKYLESLSIVLKRYRKMGLGRFVDKLIYEYDRANNNTSHAGEYRSGKIVSFLWEGNTPHVIAHEIGHHLYKTFLSDAQQNAWFNFIQHDLVSFSESDYNEIYHAFKTLYAQKAPHASEYSYTVDGVWQDVHKLLKTPVTKELWDAYCKQNAHIHISPLKSDPEASFKNFRSETAKPFVLHAPTAYSSKNPEEAFCETIANYVEGTPLTPLIKHQFEMITGLRSPHP